VTVWIRRLAFAVGACGLLSLLAWGVSGLPAFGHYRGPYGDQVVPRAVHDRHATNATTTVVMDIRAVDTAGEELILFASVIGVLMLLRELRGEESTAQPSEERAIERVRPSAAARVAAAVLVAPTFLFGEYLVVHGQITPGGGFQGGVVLAGPSVLLLLAMQGRSFDRLHEPFHWEAAQAAAVTGFLLVGFIGLLASAHAFLANFLPRGTAGTVYSSGTIPVLNLLASVAVATAIALVVIELRHQYTGVRGR
jgi:multicomponent Na+:H+ antiporter subunit B